MVLSPVAMDRGYATATAFGSDRTYGALCCMAPWRLIPMRGVDPLWRLLSCSIAATTTTFHHI